MGVSLLEKFDVNLKKLSLKPLEYIQLQVIPSPARNQDTSVH